MIHFVVAVSAGLRRSPAGRRVAIPVAAQVPKEVTPPGGKAAMTLKGAGMLTYECRTADGKTAWAFAGPDAKHFSIGRDPS